MSLFQTDKTALLLWIMEHYDVKYNQNRDSNQKISCINRYAHSHGDRNPSAGINISKGLYRCFACGLAGDGYTVLRELEGWGVKQVNEAFGGTPVNEDESDVWI